MEENPAPPPLDDGRRRSRVVKAIEGYFVRRGYPRFTLGLVLVLTGFAGFGISFLLLRAGLGDMWLRYPVAVLGAYAVFLLLMRVWVEIERRNFDPEDPELLAALEKDRPTPVFTDHQKGKGSWLDWLDLPADLIPGDDGCLGGLVVLALVGVVVGLIGLLLAVLAAAPALIAEVFLDAVLVGVLYRRLKIAAKEHWLGTCIRKTWLFVLVTTLLLFIVGMVLTVSAPGTKSLGPALEHIFRPKG